MKKLKRGEIIRTILIILAAATIVVTVAALPNLALTMKLLPRSVRKRFVLQSIWRMQSRGLIYVHGTGQKKTLSLTAEGKQRADFEELTLPRYTQNLSKEGWFVVSFDIPETHGGARKALTRKLQEIGFFKFQKSSYVYPRSCVKEIECIRNYFQVKKYITYFNVLHFEPEEELRLRKHFDIKK